MGIGSIMSELLKEKNTNVPELARKANISQSTLYSIIKRDNMKVDIDILIRIADILGVTADYFYDKRTPMDFTLNETEIIKKYRALDERGKANVLAILDQEYNHSQENDEAPSENKVG